MARGKPPKSPDDLPLRRSKPKALTALVSAITATALSAGAAPQQAKATTEPVAISKGQQSSTGAPAKLVLRVAGSQVRLAQDHFSHESHSSHSSHYSSSS